MGPNPSYIYAQSYNGAFLATAIPLLCDANGVLLTGPASVSPGAGVVPNVAGFFQANALIPTATYGETGLSLMYGIDPVSGEWDSVGLGGNSTDAQATSPNVGLATVSDEYGFNGLTWDRIRVANIFHSAVATAIGATAVWTPAVGKKFRLMGYTISVSGTLAAAGTQVLQLLDAAAIIKRHNATVQSVITGDTQIGADLGNGQLSAAANNVLNINLGTAMATGSVAVNVWGTEE